MSVLDMVSCSLAPTATYKRRDVVWIPAAPGAFPDGRIGSLTIILQHSLRRGAKQEVDTYGVDEEHDLDHPDGLRSFLLANDTDPEQPDVYRCTVGCDALGLVLDRCTCRAGQIGKGCKHVDALDYLINVEGVL